MERGSIGSRNLPSAIRLLLLADYLTGDSLSVPLAADRFARVKAAPPAAINPNPVRGRFRVVYPWLPVDEGSGRRW
jgi:hypothetical protein